MTCLSCLPEDLEAEEGCLDGDIYTYCESPLCGGLCEYIGKCDCDCHQQTETKGDDDEL